MDKPISAYEKDLQEDIKIIKKLKSVPFEHWCSLIMSDEEYFQKKYNDGGILKDNTQK